jgi:transposase
VLFGDLVPAAGLRLDDLVLTPSTAVALLVSTSTTAACPHCGTPSPIVHSRYRRTVADLPCQGRPVALRLVVRKFRCTHPGCPRRIFCERLPGLLDAHARPTARLTDAHRAIGFALGGEAGARLAGRLDMPTSPDTLLRRVKAAPDEPTPPPRYVGVDDWAIRKGQRYGTILIDLERGRVLDILEGRDGAALQAWLKEHPGVEVISRDRWAAYAQAASAAAPQARQVADRWHLLKNLREAIERLLGRCSAEVRAALQGTPAAGTTSSAIPSPSGSPSAVESPSGGEATASPQVVPPIGPAVTLREQARDAKRRQRTERHQQVRALRGQGLSVRQIARQVGLNVKAVRRYLREQRCPDWNPGRQPPTQLDAFAPFIDAWVAGGGRNAAELYRQLVCQGSQASYDAVRRFLRRRLGSTGRPGPRTGVAVPPASPAPTARKLSFEFIRRPGDRKTGEQSRLDRLRAGVPVLPEGLDLAAELAEMLRKKSKLSLSEWLTKVERSGVKEMRSSAEGLRQDEAAVQAALVEPWSNGPVEGQVNRLKLIKRQMYGRAGFKLLRARVLYAA